MVKYDDFLYKEPDLVFYRVSINFSAMKILSMFRDCDSVLSSILEMISLLSMFCDGSFVLSSTLKMILLFSMFWDCSSVLSTFEMISS